MQSIYEDFLVICPFTKLKAPVAKEYMQLFFDGYLDKRSENGKEFIFLFDDMHNRCCVNDTEKIKVMRSFLSKAKTGKHLKRTKSSIMLSGRGILFYLQCFEHEARSKHNFLAKDAIDFLKFLSKNKKRYIAKDNLNQIVETKC